MIQPKDEEIRDAKISGIQRQVAECIQSAYTKGYETCFEQKMEIEERAYASAFDSERYRNEMVSAYNDGQQKGYELGIQEGIVQANKSYKNCKTYEQGLSDAWEIMRKIHAMDMVVRKETFGYFNPSYLIKEYSVQDAINILREEEEKQKKSCDTCFYGDEHDGDTNMFCIYNCLDDDRGAWKPKEEEKKADDEIKVGDEVIAVNSISKPYVITDLSNNCVYGIDESGIFRGCSRKESDFKKTGRHFDIDKVLEQMRG